VAVQLCQRVSVGDPPTLGGMDDMRIGAAFRAVRLRRHWRQSDVAERAGVSRALVSLVERGHFAHTNLDTLRRIALTLDIRVDVWARWRGGDLDRLLNARHSALHESVAVYFARQPGWRIAPEVSFSIYGERGVIDILAFHPASGCLLVIELKTMIVDVNDLIGSMDRRRRLAPEIALPRGWHADRTSAWVIVERGRTNQRRIAAHAEVLGAAFPAGGRAMETWLQRPSSVISALSTWPYAILSSVPVAPRHRVRPTLPKTS